MTPDEFAVIDGAVNQVSGWYARRCWWADPRDLKQEGWCACLQARRTYDPARGSPGGYYWSAATYALRSYLYETSRPVSTPKGHVPELPAVAAELGEWHGVNYETPEKLFDMAHWLATARTRLHELLTGVTDADLAQAVLLDEEKPVAVAAATKQPIQRVYNAAQRFRSSISGDLTCYMLVRRAQE